MKVTFVSNYINHHQIPFCKAMYAALSEDYCFIQTEPMEEERIRMGWGTDTRLLPWLKLYYEEEAVCKKKIAESDVVLFGGVEDETYIADRLQEGKIVVRLSERIYKEGQWKAISPRGLKKKYHDHTRYRKNPVYLLCCGGYVASDFRIIRAYPDKMFQWGYFPEKKTYDVEALFTDKKRRRTESEKISLLWAGRFIDWKHPEYAIRAAARLKKEGYAFTLTMAGGGVMEEELRQMAVREGLEEEVCFTGFQKPEKIREYMEQADIFLFTSDYREGWGAVLNEAMNSGCAVVANTALGAAPFLIKPGKNGLLYPNRKFEKFYENVTKLIQNPDMMEKMGHKAYDTIVTTWNAEEAARRLLTFLQNLMQGEILPEKADILSPAFIVKPGRMYRYLTERETE